MRYKISGRGKAPKYFKVDDNTGVITIKEYLRNEPDRQYEVCFRYLPQTAMHILEVYLIHVENLQIEVRAFDSGEPPLMGSTTVTVFVEHVAALTPRIDLGLSDSKYT